ncbi:MAG: tRNA delta(2)-isopentenylpyrophosphate transferase, tRNA dimethylallyltransferase [Candidatus Berkelbacteria bacterium]|nr:tRNA delta(2)-isopentenylpyrophosphate transferase, tRNA dimethylallyltransferase [Candidatus Berkelbacteria bacterium]
MSKKSNKIIAIVGPTASGKTEWAKKLALKFNGKVISADSRQIYRGFDIGTGKDKSFRQDLIDIIEPFEKFTVWDYQQLASNLVNQYFSMKSLPIIAGGTGLYLYAVLYGYILPGVKKESDELRKKLEKLSENTLYEKLKKIDLAAADKIDPKNKRRVIRALEVSILSKKPFSEFQKKLKPKFKTLIIGIKTDRETIYSKIDARVEQMVKDGLVEEVRGLIKKYQSDLPAFNTIGYKEIIDYLRGKTTLKESILNIKNNTHSYVRRQETWFKKNKDIKWVSRYEDAEKLTHKFLKK